MDNKDLGADPALALRAKPASGLVASRIDQGEGFTLGPWMVHGDEVVAERYGERVICAPLGDTWEQAEGNARLIAAAPDMFAVIDEFLAYLDGGAGSLPHRLEYAMRDALAKARGAS